MKKIIFSLATVAAVGALVVGATGAFFSDQETAVGNTYTAGTIDIAVDGENPWQTSWENYLDKPCQTNYMNFVIRNDGENPARIWKRLTNVVNGPGADNYNGASSEPEYEAGLIGEDQYVERDNLSAFMIYDMYICITQDDNAQDDNGNACSFIDDGYGNIEKPDTDTGWTVLIDEASQVRVDNVADTWIELIDELQPGQELHVSQSYHLMTWDDSGQPMVTNWAQGDTMTFDVELEARQLDAPAPGTTMQGDAVVATVQFVQRDATTWEETAAPQGTLTYAVEGETFDYDISVTGLVANENYSLIYYADPYPGNHPGALISDYTADGSGVINASGESVDLALDLPDPADANYPAGAKLWLVLAADYSEPSLTAWNPDSYLFDKGLVNYEDTND